MKVTKPFDFYNIPEGGWVETKSGTKVLDLTYLRHAKTKSLVGVLQGDSTETWHFDGVYHHDREPSCLDLIIVEEVEDELFYWGITGTCGVILLNQEPTSKPPAGFRTPQAYKLVPVEQ